MIVYRELSSIERELGIPLKTMYAVSNRIDKHYHKVTVPKKNGGTRVLSVPDDILKKIQRAIVEKLLVFRSVSKYAKAYKIASSIRKNALPHVGKDKLVKLDILHFFDSILYATVKEKAFPADVFDEKIRILLTKLCYFKDTLPQGAPSSPIISNIVLYDFDETLGRFCEERAIAYTRYCDDMTFSGDFDETELISFVETTLRSYGFFLNRSKTAIVTKGKRQIVTGIVVNNKLNIAKDYKREIRKELYYIQKFGLKEHLARTAPTLSETKYLNRLIGRINFVLSVCPGDETMLFYRQALILLL